MICTSFLLFPYETLVVCVCVCGGGVMKRAKERRGLAGGSREGDMAEREEGGDGVGRREGGR